MNPLKKIERWKEITPDVANVLVDRININSKITASKGIRVTTSPTGTHLSGKGRPPISSIAIDHRVRSAEIQSIDGKVLTVQLWEYDGTEWSTPGANITVDCTSYHLGDNDLDGDVWPDYAVGDSIQIFLDMDGEWYPIPTLSLIHI